MQIHAAEPPIVRFLSAIFQSIPAGTKGKARLGRLALRPEFRTSPVLVRAGDALMATPNLTEPVGFNLWLNGVYEPDTLRFLRERCSPNGAFLDIGANIGAFSVALAGYAKQVIAIEPSPQVLPYLRRNIELNGLSNVRVFECAASTHASASVPLYVPPETSFGMASSAPQFGVEPIAVEAKPIDGIVAEAGVERVSIIKADIEGYEAHAFEGARELLTAAEPPPVCFEFLDWAEERAFPGRKGYAQSVLLDFGYKLWTLERFRDGFPPLRKPLVEGSWSLVAVHRSML